MCANCLPAEPRSSQFSVQGTAAQGCKQKTTHVLLGTTEEAFKGNCASRPFPLNC